MREHASDARIPLEWNSEANCWELPLIEQEWADFKGLMNRSADGFLQIPPEKYHLHRNSGGGYGVMWTAPQAERPLSVYGLVAVRPKQPGTFWGIPLALIVPVITALATAAGTIAVQSAAHSRSVTDGSADSALTTELRVCEGELATLESAAETLKICEEERQSLHEFILPRPREHRSLYILGYSHGQRLEAIKKLPVDDMAVNIALQAEEAYVQSMLASDVSSIAFSRGKSDGQEEAIKLLELGDLQILSGTDLQDVR